MYPANHKEQQGHPHGKPICDLLEHAGLRPSATAGSISRPRTIGRMHHQRIRLRPAQALGRELKLQNVSSMASE